MLVFIAMAFQLTSGTAQTGENCPVAADEIGGSVWQDFDFDGEMNEFDTLGLEGIEVALYDCNDMLVGTTTTDADGNYVFMGLGGGPLVGFDEERYRVEFTLPMSEDIFDPTFAGADGGTTVQFASPGDCVSLGVADVAEYCEENPFMVLTCFDAGEGATGPALVRTDYNFSGRTTLADFEDLGAAWGVGFQMQDQKVFVGSFIKRNVELAQDIGHIHITDYISGYEGSFNLQGVNGIDVGSLQRNGGVDSSLVAAPATAPDLDGFCKVGTAGLGDVNVFNDSLLFVVNLNSKSLITVDVTDPSLLPTDHTAAPASLVSEYPLTFPDDCSSGEMRPFGLEFHRGQGYIGVVCDASISRDTADLISYVYRFDPNNVAGGLTQVTSVPMSYSRENRGFNSGTRSEWQPWTCEWDSMTTTPFPAFFSMSYSSPMLTDIEFDEFDNMILAFNDRVSNQIGSEEVLPLPTGHGITPNSASSFSAGDILKVCYVNGAYVLEGGTGCEVGADYTNGGILFRDDDGPSGAGEFYGGDYFDAPSSINSGHPETALGGLAHLHGRFEVLATVYDVTAVNQPGGIFKFNDADGARNDSIIIVDRGATAFQKATGVGDLELLCNSAPIEIGNYVWNDLDGDGVQSACEPPLEGVNVTIYDSNGDSITTVMTDADGQYYFNSFDSISDGMGGMIPVVEADSSYFIVFGTGGQYANDVLGDSLSLTVPDVGQDSMSDINDSDATTMSGMFGGAPFIEVTAPSSGGVDHSLDVGFAPAVSVGSTVWIDANNDGMYDEGSEDPVEGIVVFIYEDVDMDGVPDGPPIASDTTDTDGNYFFSGLMEGDYVIGLTPPDTLDLSSTVTDSLDNGEDNDDNGIQMSAGDPIFSPTINLMVDDETSTEPGSGGDQDSADDDNGDMTIDFGLIPSVSLGSTVFVDSDNNNMQDPGEDGLEGVIVILYDDMGNVVATDTTDAMGNYFFDGLVPGDYSVAIVPPTDFPNSSDDTGSESDPNDDIDGNDNGFQVNPGDTIFSNPITLDPFMEPSGGDEDGTGGDQDDATDDSGNMTLDFGLYPGLSIGSTVFADNDNDGMHEPGDGEAGIPGVLVILFDDAGMPIDSTITDSNGDYFFGGLPEGTYSVGIPMDAFGVGEGLENYPNSSTPTEDDPNTDTDEDDNGMQPGGVGTVVMSGPIDLSLGDEPEDGDESGSGGTQDDGDDANGNMTVDFGFFPNMSIGSTVFSDADDSGTQDMGEDGVAGVEVFLYDPVADTIIAMTTTDMDGNYVFDSLPPGDYVVAILPPDTLNTSSTPTTTTDDNVDGDDNGSQVNPGDTIFSPVVSLVPGTEPSGESGQGGDQETGDDDNGDMTIDFGLVPSVSVGSTVWLDDNNDGMYDEGTEDPIEGIVVSIYEDTDGDGVPDGPAIATDTTDAMGNYFFDGLPEGMYVLGLTPPDSVNLSSGPTVDMDDNGAVDNDDNGIQENAGDEIFSPSITLTNNGEATGEPDSGGDQDMDDDNNGDMTVDFGLVPSVSLGSTVFLDSDNNNMQDAGEEGIAGVTVILYDDMGDIVATTVTDADGNYYFDGLYPGDYVVGVVPPADNPLSSDDTGSETDPNDDVDGNDNGFQVNPGDTIFSNPITLEPNTEPEGESEQGGDQDADNDNDGNMTVDFGLYPGLSIGSTVFADNDNDGMHEPGDGENGIPGVLVILFDDAGMPIDSTITDSNGDYFFGGLPEGTYSVGIPMDAFGTGEGLEGYPNSSTPTEADPNDDVDGNDNGMQPGGAGTVVMSGPIELSIGDEPEGSEESGSGGTQDDIEDANGNMTVDFGFFPNMSIGSTVFSDVDDSGTQDMGEDGVAGVEVFLYDPVADTIIAMTTTDMDGNYVFDSLPPGDYIVAILPPDTLNTSSTPTNTTDDQLDGDDNGSQVNPGDTIFSPVVSLVPGTEPSGEPGQGGDQETGDDDNGDMTIDFGLVPSVSVGSTVWLDDNNDGMYDEGTEDPIEGIVVSIYEDTDGDGVPDGPAIATDTTDAMGNYFFDGLPEGMYVLGLTPPDSVNLSSGPTVDMDDNGAVDNDDNGIQENAGDEIFSPSITLTNNGEATGEPDSGGDQDMDDDNNGDMTVDFGLVPSVSLGSTVFLDSDNNNMQDAGEEGIAGVTVILYDDMGDIVATTVTDADGNYYFDGLYPGDYVVGVVPPADNPLSSDDTGSETDPNDDVDGNDNGFQVNPGDTIFSNVITLEPNTEPEGESEQGGDQDADNDNDGNMTVDFGLYPGVSIGSTVFSDIDDDGIHEPGDGENGIPGVLVILFDDTGMPVDSTITDSNGDYYFGGLPEGTYTVGIPADAFGAGESLEGYPNSSTDIGTTGDPNNDTDADDNGMQPGGAGTVVMSGPIVLTVGGEPTGGDENGSGGTQDDGADGNGNMTVDFGFRPLDCPVAEITILGDPELSCLDSLLLEISIMPEDSMGVWGTDGSGTLSTTMSGDGGQTVYTPAMGEDGEVLIYFTVPAEDPACPTNTDTVAIWVINDVTPPMFVNCPSDTITVGNDSDNCDGGANWAIPVAEDNCCIDTVEQTVGPAPGSVLPVGLTEIQYVATDKNGNADTCTFYINVVDTQEPLLVCPKDMTMNADAGLCSWTSPEGALNPVIAQENCAADLQHTITLGMTAMGSDTGFVPMTTFPLGESTICYSLSDSSGMQTDTCCFTVTIIDTEAPTLNCPSDMTVGNDAGACNASLPLLGEAPAMDNCGIDTVLAVVQNPDGSRTMTDAMGNYTFEKGRSEVTLTAIDDSGNETTCSYQVVVEDTELPTIECPTGVGPMDALIRQATTECSYTFVGMAADPTYSDNCGDSTITHNYAPAPSRNTLRGAEFPVGVTRVVWTVTDCGGNTATCVVRVDVRDNVAPEFVNCPSDTITVGNDVDNCDGGANWSIPVATDNCGIDTVEQITGPAPGSVLPVGITDIVYVARDTSGNTDTCAFVIEVIDTQTPLLACPKDMTMSNDEGECSWTSPMDALNPVIARENCEADLQHTITLADGTMTSDTGFVMPTVLPVGDNEICYYLSDSSGMQTDSCCFTVTVEDNEGPVIADCNALALFGFGLETLSTNVDCQYQGQGVVGITDNCQEVVDVYAVFTNPDGTIETDTLMSLGGDSYAWDVIFEKGITTYEIVAQDSSGNESRCLGQVEVIDNVPPTIECPADMEVSADAGECDFTMPGTGFDPTYMDNCPDSTVTHDYVFAPSSNTLAGASFPVGDTEVTWTVTDEAGNSASCSFTITVTDDEAPQITNCPASGQIIQDTDDGSCEAIVNFSNITGIDNCNPLDSLTIEYMLSGGLTQSWTEGQASGLSFPLDTTTVSYRITDTSGNVSDTCEFDVIVVDNQAPDAICRDIEVFLDENGMATIVVDSIDGGSYDNCGIESLLPMGDLMYGCDDLGFNELTLVAIDSSGNTDSCVAVITVRDTIAPDFECPADMTVGGCSGTVPDLITGLTGTDNCDDVVFTQTPRPGVTFGPNADDTVGVKIVATDGSGNMSMCIVTLTIIDNEDPYFQNCPDSIMVCNDVDQCFAKVNWLAPVAFDNCDDSLDVVQTMGPIIGSEFPVGRTQIEYTATDDDGNTITCSFEVIVLDCQSPTAICKDIDVVVGGDCEVTILPGDVDAGSFDNCGLVEDSTQISMDGITFMDSIVLTQADLDPSQTTIWLRVVDSVGNASVCTADIEVFDVDDPMVVCQDDITIYTEPDVCYGIVPNVLPPFDTSDNCLEIPEINQVPQPGVVWGSKPGDSLEIFVEVIDTDGNRDTCSLFAVLVDTMRPHFINCPRPTINVKTLPDWCGAFVNFSLPVAEDNCDDLVIRKLDDTGLTTGDMFPVGATVLSWIAEDASGNLSDTCRIKIIVNDAEAPTIECPEDVTVGTDAGACEATVRGIGPVIEDQCPDNVLTTFSIVNTESGDQISAGFEDASGELFGCGENVVTYRTQDHPLVLITEVSQELESAVGGTNPVPGFITANTTSGDDYVEVTNFGPNAIELNCLVLYRTSVSGVDSIMVPYDQELASGAVAVFHFGGGTNDASNNFYVNNLASDLGSGTAAGYELRFEGGVVDAVATNGGSAADFSGNVASAAGTAGIIREFIWDTDSADDWYVAEGCREQSIGSYNPDYPAAVDNGSSPAVGLQSFTNEGSECSFTVTVEDTELPMCGMLELNSYAGSTGSITAGCNEFTVTVGDAFEIGRVIIPVLDITHPAMGELSASLESPSGTEVEVSLMVPDTLIAFNGELSSGDWILRISDEAVANDGSLDAWTLELYERQAYNRPDTVVDNDPGLCSAEVTFNAPELIDNCDVGNVIVSYTTMDDIDVPDGGEVEPGAPITEVFGVGTTDVLFTLFDKAGNSSTCGFSITVEDVEPPVVTCPDDITIDLEGGECDAIVNFLPETAEDNCSIDTIYSFPPSGSVFSVGTTEVILIVEDPAGNSDTCTFNVIVNENIPEDNSLTCVGLLNVSLDENCEACIGADELLMGDDYKCYEDYCIVITDSDGNVLPDTCIGLDQVGDTLSVSVTDCGGTGVSCWGYIYVEDKLVPEVECPDDITVACNEGTDTGITGVAELRSCEQSVTIDYTDEYEEYGLCDSIRAQITRTWTATDESGNVGSCVQVISVKGFDELDLEFPSDITYDDGIRCEDVANDASATDPVRTGVPTIRGNSIYDNNSFCEVNVGYWDEFLQDANCGNGYEILRNWIIRDECRPLEVGVNPIRHIQSIRVIDLTPPTIECNEDLTIAVDAHNCFTVFNPMDYAPEASDNCGDIASIELVGGFSSSVLPLGDHQFTYRVTDNCRNSSECTINVSVVDRTVPVVICETFRQVALLPDGLAKVEAESFDDGSYDNCNPVWFKARRMEQGECSQVNGDDSTSPGYQEWFDDYVKFCCDDINNDDLLVVLRVYDVDPGVGPVSPDAFEGHWNECMVRVDVQDKLPPVIVCPADVTISCSDDYELDNLSEYGDPFVTDACDVTWEERVIAPNDCGAGQRVIRRIFTATDEQGLTSQCIQNIYLVDPTPFTICDTESRLAPLSGNCANNTTGHTRRDGVEWPADVELSTCMGGLSPEDLKANPSVDNRDAMPTIVGGACAQIAMDYDDESFAIVDDACEKIIRTWTIIDWCQFDAVTRDPEDADRFLGYWQYIQIIKLKNTIGPAIENCEDLAICDDAAAGCDAQLDFTLEVSDDCTDSLEIEVTWRLDADNDGVYDISGEGARINRRVPLGVHRIQWRVEDGCDNFELCEQIITATDCKLPTPYCDNGIATVVMPSTGSIEVWARDLDEGSFDNCTEQEDLEFLIQKLDDNGDPVGPKAGAITLTCEDIPNGVAQTIDVRVYVIDEAGNEDYCVTYILLQDTPDADNPEGVCDDEIEVPLVGGDIETETGRNASLHSVRMIDTEGKEVEMVSFTDMGGEYVFGMMDEGYSVLPYKNDDAANGLSTLDLIAIQRHILGVQRLDSPYKMVAADVDHNEQINVLDLLDLQEVILGLRDEFRNNLSWRYSEVENAPTMNAPYSIVEEVSLAEKTASQLLDIDFTAIKIGDVNGDVNPVGLTTGRTIEKRGSGLELEVSPEEVKKDATQGTIRVPVRASNFKDLLGYQFSLEYSENWSYVEIESGALEIASDQVHESSRTSLVTNWYTAQAESFTSDEVLFTLVFVGEKTSEVKELSILDAHITAESYVSVSASNAEEVQIQGVELRVGEKTATEAVFVLHQNDPNPWKDQTVIRYELPEEMGVTIRVVNAEGVELHRAEQAGLVGMNEYVLRGSDLGNYSGVLYYRVETENYQGSKKMIRVE